MVDIKKLEEQRDKINARIQKERAKEKAQKRKYDTRAKILLGSAVLQLIEKGESLQVGGGFGSSSISGEQLKNELAARLQESDRERLDFCLNNRK